MVALRAGAYKVAVKAKAPVVPIAIIGSSQLKNKKFFKRVKINLYILKPLYYEEYVKLTEFLQTKKDYADRKSTRLNSSHL